MTGKKPMELTDEQRRAVERPGHLVVVAGAGSGKTRVLVERYLRLLVENDLDPLSAVESLLAITFTEKAAREMRERVRLAVEQQARAASTAERVRWEERRAAIEAAHIGTIHGFCAALLRAHPVESGCDPRFTVLDEVQSALLIETSIGQALADAVARAEETELLAELGPVELQAMLAEMLAAGGELDAALAHMPAEPADLLQHWQTRSASFRNELLADLQAAPAWCAAVDQLNSLAPGAPPGDKIGDQVRLVVALFDRLAASGDPAELAGLDAINLQGGSKKAWGSDEPLRMARTALNRLRTAYRDLADLLNPPADRELEQRAAHLAIALRRIYRQTCACYQANKTAQSLLDFNDLERLARGLLEAHPAVRLRWRSNLRALLVDEFQDTNDDQRAVIYALIGSNEPAGPYPELFIVGDGKQSIYRFRGADVSVFRQVEADLSRNGGERVELAASFRSHQMLVAWINRVAAAIFARPVPLRPFEMPYAALQARRPQPPYQHCVELHLVQVHGDAAARRAAEAAVLAARLRAIVEDGEPLVYDQVAGWRAAQYDDIALLFQAGTVFEEYETALRAAGIPFLTTAGRGYYGRKEIQDLINLLRVLDDPADDLALVGVLRSPLFALDDGTILRLRFAEQRTLWQALQVSVDDPTSTALAFARTTLGELAGLHSRLTVVELLRAALAATGYLATISGLPDGERRRANVEKLIGAARLSGGRGLRTFREYLERLLRAEAREGEAPLEAVGSVRLMTVHRSKGLEFPIVGLPDLSRPAPALRPGWLARRNEGLLLPLRNKAGEVERSAAFRRALYAEQRMETAERERLLYVALTRARDYLLLCGAATNTDGDNWLSRILTALDCPWSIGGPPAGTLGALLVQYHQVNAGTS